MNPVDDLLYELERKAGASVLDKAQSIELLVMDVDGVHTDGGLIHGADTQQFKRFHAFDGLGMKFLKQHNIKLAFITGRTSQVVEERANEIGAVGCHQGTHEKGIALKKMCDELNVATQHTAFVGDDLIDLPAMRVAGLSVATADAHELVVNQADWQTLRCGGSGAIRDVAELILHAQGKLRGVYEHYLSVC